MLHDDDPSKKKPENTLFLLLFEAAFCPYLNNLITQQNNADLTIARLMHEIMIEDFIQLQFQRRIDEIREDFVRLEKIERELSDKIKLDQISDYERKQKETQIFAELNALKQKLEKIREDLNKRISELTEQRNSLLQAIQKNIVKYDELYSKTLKEAAILLKDENEAINFGEKSKVISYSDLINKLEEKISGKFAAGEIQIEDREKAEKEILIELITKEVQSEINVEEAGINTQIEDVAERVLNQLNAAKHLTESYKESEKVICAINEEKNELKVIDKKLQTLTIKANKLENAEQFLGSIPLSDRIDVAAVEQVEQLISDALFSHDDELELDFEQELMSHNDFSNNIPPPRQDKMLTRTIKLGNDLNGNVPMVQEEKNQAQVNNDRDPNNIQDNSQKPGNDSEDDRKGLSP